MKLERAHSGTLCAFGWATRTTRMRCMLHNSQLFSFRTRFLTLSCYIQLVFVTASYSTLGSETHRCYPESFSDWTSPCWPNQAFSTLSVGILNR